jgi:hypothetical protein
MREAHAPGCPEILVISGHFFVAMTTLGRAALVDPDVV